MVVEKQDIYKKLLQECSTYQKLQERCSALQAENEQKLFHNHERYTVSCLQSKFQEYHKIRKIIIEDQSVYLLYRLLARSTDTALFEAFKDADAKSDVIQTLTKITAIVCAMSINDPYHAITLDAVHISREYRTRFNGGELLEACNALDCLTDFDAKASQAEIDSVLYKSLFMLESLYPNMLDPNQQQLANTTRELLFQETETHSPENRKISYYKFLRSDIERAIGCEALAVSRTLQEIDRRKKFEHWDKVDYSIIERVIGNEFNRLMYDTMLQHHNPKIRNSFIYAKPEVLNKLGHIMYASLRICTTDQEKSMQAQQVDAEILEEISMRLCISDDTKASVMKKFMTSRNEAGLLYEEIINTALVHLYNHHADLLEEEQKEAIKDQVAFHAECPAVYAPDTQDMNQYERLGFAKNAEEIPQYIRPKAIMCGTNLPHKNKVQYAEEFINAKRTHATQLANNDANNNKRKVEHNPAIYYGAKKHATACMNAREALSDDQVLTKSKKKCRELFCRALIDHYNPKIRKFGRNISETQICMLLSDLISDFTIIRHIGRYIESGPANIAALDDDEVVSRFLCENEDKYERDEVISYVFEKCRSEYLSFFEYLRTTCFDNILLWQIAKYITLAINRIKNIAHGDWSQAEREFGYYASCDMRERHNAVLEEEKAWREKAQEETIDSNEPLEDVSSQIGDTSSHSAIDNAHIQRA